MVSIGLHSVSRTFPDGTVAVRDLDVEVSSGELLAITGPSGSGKTTVLRLVAGLDHPSSGQITFDGKVIDALEPRRRDVALVASERGLYPFLTARQNLAFALRLRGTPPDETHRRVQAEARVLGIRQLLDRTASTLAHGEQQRVALGRATARVPRAFLLDEPLAPLDAGERARLRAEFAQLQQGLGVTTLYVTHDQQEAMALGHRLAVLDGGRLQQVARPQEVYDRPANTAVATFVGSPSMNLLAGRVTFEGTVAHLLLGPNRLRLTDTQRRALGARGGDGRWTVGLRPEHLSAPTSMRADRRILLDVGTVAHTGSHVTVRGTFVDGREEITARLPMRPVRPGEHLPLAVDVAALHFFEPTTGRASLHGRSSHR